jgi:hypothetical protein
MEYPFYFTTRLIRGDARKYPDKLHEDFKMFFSLPESVWVNSRKERKETGSLKYCFYERVDFIAPQRFPKRKQLPHL